LSGKGRSLSSSISDSGPRSSPARRSATSVRSVGTAERRDHRSRKLSHRMAARTQGRKSPNRPGRGKQAGFERFEQTGAHQRGLAASRATGHHE